MKRWALLTVLLYAMALLALTVPVLCVVSVPWQSGVRAGLAENTADALKLYAQWGYWLWLGIMLAAQACLLLVPLAKTERRSKPRRPLLVPLLTATFLLGNLGFAGGLSVACAIFGDDALEAIDQMAKAALEFQLSIPGWNRLAKALGLDQSFFAWTTVLGLVLASWLVWGLIFYRFAQRDDPDALNRRATHWLLRGSILELLVAVPSHIIIRSRDDCCAPLASFWGIVTGLSVMLLAFGPGVFFLFVERRSRLRPRGTEAEPPVIGSP
jgi:hypothetical protein